jgi:hypothetical protein
MRATTNTDSPCLMPKYPDPPLFSEKNRRALCLVSTQHRIKLFQNATHYPNDEASLRYTISRLEDVALVHILLKVTETMIQLD